MIEPLQTALNALPHGPEFRFLDQLTTLDPGVAGSGGYRLHGNEPFLSGHFPDNPLMPGVLIIEAAAQLAGVVAQSHPDIPPLPALKLAAIRNAKFYSVVRPGDRVILEARILARLGTLVQAHASASVGDRKVLEAELTLSGENPDVRQRTPPT